jgi:hypothetical protein
MLHNAWHFFSYSQHMMMKTSLTVLHVLLMMQGLCMLMLVEGHMSFSHIHRMPHKAVRGILNVLCWTHIPLLHFFLAFQKVPILQTTIHWQIGNKFKSIPHTWHNTKENCITNYSHHFVSYQKSQSTHKIYNTKSSLTFPTQQQSQTPTKNKTKQTTEVRQHKTQHNEQANKPQRLQPCLSSSSAKLTRLKGDTNPKKGNDLISHFIWTSWVGTSDVAGCVAAPDRLSPQKEKT